MRHLGYNGTLAHWLVQAAGLHFATVGDVNPGKQSTELNKAAVTSGRCRKRAAHLEIM